MGAGDLLAAHFQEVGFDEEGVYAAPVRAFDQDEAREGRVAHGLCKALAALEHPGREEENHRSAQDGGGERQIERRVHGDTASLSRRPRTADTVESYEAAQNSSGVNAWLHGFRFRAIVRTAKALTTSSARPARNRLDAHGGTFDVHRWPTEVVPSHVWGGYRSFFTREGDVLHEHGFESGDRFDREITGLTRPKSLVNDTYWACVLEESGGVACVKKPAI